jgi:hypothetical protein
MKTAGSLRTRCWFTCRSFETFSPRRPRKPAACPRLRSARRLSETSFWSTHAIGPANIPGCYAPHQTGFCSMVSEEPQRVNGFQTVCSAISLPIHQLLIALRFQFRSTAVLVRLFQQSCDGPQEEQTLVIPEYAAADCPAADQLLSYFPSSLRVYQ